MNCRMCGSALPDGAMFCGECGSAVAAGSGRSAGHRASDTVIVEPLGGWPRAGGHAASSAREELAGAADDGGRSERKAEPERGEAPSAPSAAVPPPPEAASFTLSFSTGEVATVSGTGLVGRRPRTETGERFALLLAVDDPERSVSKTHLEYGQGEDGLWVCDRFSANGTVLVTGDGRRRVCEPGRRVRVPRGSRVEIGEEYFDVS